MEELLVSREDAIKPDDFVVSTSTVDFSVSRSGLAIVELVVSRRSVVLSGTVDDSETNTLLISSL